jgi:putative transposase
VAAALDRYGDFADFIGAPGDHGDAWRALRRAETTGRPLGAPDWIAALEAKTGRSLAPQKRGPKPRIDAFSKLAP